MSVCSVLNYLISTVLPKLEPMDNDPHGNPIHAEHLIKSTLPEANDLTL